MKMLLLLAVLGGCAPQLEGAWSDRQGAGAFRLAHGKYFRSNPDGSDFKSDRPGLPPLAQAHPYKVEGKRVLVEAPGGHAEFEILPDGRLKLSQDGQAQIFVRK
jgi:hypothetical protein